MADQVNQPGRLIAVDGSRGKDVNAAANAIAAELKRRGIECAVSRWDASGLFAELAAGGRATRSISARALSLVYAADLAFRLRWEILPSLESGNVVIAAPYLDTAAAFGAGCGLSERWIRELMRFAPAPHLLGRAQERKVDRPWKARLDRGYAEYAALLLGATAPGRISKKERRAMMAALEDAGGRKVFHLTAKGVGALATSLTGSRKAASRQSASRPRNARK
jgi:Thymidylate kinase